MLDAVIRYTNSTRTSPFFLVVGDDDYKEIKSRIVDQGYKTIRLSEFCLDDGLPNFDQFRASLSSQTPAKYVVLGLGEYLSLCGSSIARNRLMALKDLALYESKVVLILRGVRNQVERMIYDDHRFMQTGAYLSPNSLSNLSFQFYAPTIQFEESTNNGLAPIYGLKKLLQNIEAGKAPNDERTGTYVVRTQLFFPDSNYNIKRIKNAYEAIRITVPNFPLEYELGSDDDWGRFFSEYQTASFNFEKLLAEHDVNLLNVESELNQNSFGYDYKSWLFFLALKWRISWLSNEYLKYAVSKSGNSIDLRNKLLYGICEISRIDNSKYYWKCYEERKSLLPSCINKAEMAAFVNEVDAMGLEGLFRLTDFSMSERRKLISSYGEPELKPYLERLYPDLAAYLESFRFECKERSDKISAYFQTYKEQKLKNEIAPLFLEQVEGYAHGERVYNYLPSRNERVEAWKKKNGVYLYWLDAFGAEYMGYVARFCQKNGLKLEVETTRADLPTITSVNSGFFDDWPDEDRFHDLDLDDIKHNAYKKNIYDVDGAPTYLADELIVIEEVLKKATVMLNSKDYRTFLLVGDHGASRLAVLKKQEEKYDCGSKGKHSGRCCKAIDGFDLSENLPCATEENGWFVLADYGRFKGSHEARVEVHGGATLEEVVVPVVALSLYDQSIKVTMITKEFVANHRTCLAFEFHSTHKLEKPCVSLAVVPTSMRDIKGKTYEAVSKDGRHYRVELTDATKPGKYRIDVCDGYAKLLEGYEINAKSGATKQQSTFGDDL
ncbi:MAG: BREX-4 system phosphatase PglZ [Thermoguttaceae bacterium]|nr:BREX-4 system phosphatase PglZ [Thermoguttaceae bacterium]